MAYFLQMIMEISPMAKNAIDSRVKLLFPFLIVCCCICGTTALADTVRVALGEIHIKECEKEMAERVSSVCALWEAHLTSKLSEFECLDVLEREDLSPLFKELELSLSGLSDANSRLQTQKLSGVDFLLLSEMTAMESTYALSSRLVSAKDGSIVKDFRVEIDVNDIYTHADDVAASIRDTAIAYFNTKDIVNLIAITDFENKSLLRRNDWMETSVSRRLRRALGRLRGVRVLEREEVDLLLKEIRLSQGGFLRQEDKDPNKDANNKKRFLVTGTYDEYQPLNRQLHLDFSINVRELELGRDVTFKTEFPLGEFDAGLINIKGLVLEQVFKADAKINKADINPDTKIRNEYESKVYLEKALNVLELNYRGLARKRNEGALTGDDYFELLVASGKNETGIRPSHANLIRAVRYLKAAVMLDDNNVRAKEILYPLLRNKPVSDLALCKELAEEIVARYPNSSRQRRALKFLVKLLKNDFSEAEPYLQLLIENYPRSTEARDTTYEAFRAFMRQGNVHRVSKIEKAREYMQVMLQWAEPQPYYLRSISTCVGNWFRLTQNSPDYQDFGEKLIGQMMCDAPDSAPVICTAWAECWFKKDSRKAKPWCERGLKLLEAKQESNQLFLEVKDYLNYMLARILLGQGEFQLALGHANDCPVLRNRVYRGEPRYIKAVSLYKLGQYRDALAEFEQLEGAITLATDQELGSEKYLKECRKALGIVEKEPPKPDLDAAPWISPHARCLRAGEVSALTLDGNDIWVGKRLGRDRVRWITQEPSPAWKLRHLTNLGGLIRYNFLTKQATQFKVGKEITSPWITSVYAQKGHVWVGTYGAGLDVYDKKTSTWSNISEANGLPSNYIRCLAWDDSYLWIGAAGALARLDLRTRKIHTFLPRDFPADSPPPTSAINDMDVAGNYLWCALGKKGAAKYDRKRNLWSYYRPCPSTTSVATFNSRVWFSSSRFNGRHNSKAADGAKFSLEGREIYSCDFNGDNWHSISMKEGLPKAEIRTMEAYNGQLFLGTCGGMAFGLDRLPGPHGLIVMDREHNFRVYQVSHTLHRNQPQLVGVTTVLALPGEIWVGTCFGVKILKLP